MVAGLVSWAVIALLVAGASLAALYSRRWRAGAAAEVDLVAGFKALPKRYLVDVHDIVGRKPFNARFHALTAGGFLASLVLIVLAVLPRLGGAVVWALAGLALAVMLAGALMVG